MKLYIPEIGDIIILNEDWTFSLFNEYRNEKLVSFLSLDQKPSFNDVYAARRALGANHLASQEARTQLHIKYEQLQREYDTPWTITLPKGSILRVDRIYIRKGASDFSSITFYLLEHPTITGKKPRFWAKLSDVNNIEYTKPSS